LHIFGIVFQNLFLVTTAVLHFSVQIGSMLAFLLTEMLSKYTDVVTAHI
jgi:hypothetical protein